MDPNASVPSGQDSDVFADSIAELTWREVEDAAHNGAVVLWAFGVIEQHGPHLPCGTDVYLPSTSVRRIRRELGTRGIRSLIMPPYYWGVNAVSASFPGSYNVRPQVTQDLVADVVAGLARDGFRHVFCFSGHGDALHNQTVYAAANLASQVTGIDVSFVAETALIERLGLHVTDAQLTVLDPLDGGDVLPAAEPQAAYPDLHAGCWETSNMMAAVPALVREDERAALVPTNLDASELGLWRRGALEARQMTPDGYLGDPARATTEQGRRQLDRHAALAAEAIAGRLARLTPAASGG